MDYMTPISPLVFMFRSYVLSLKYQKSIRDKDNLQRTHKRDIGKFMTPSNRHRKVLHIPHLVVLRKWDA